MKFFSCFQRYERIILLRRKWLPERLRLFTAIHNNRPIAYRGPHVKFRGGPHLPLPRHWTRTAWLNDSKNTRRESFLFDFKWMKQSYLVLGNQSTIAVAPSAKVETCRNDAIDPESSRDRGSTWIEMRGKQKPNSPKPREIDDTVQLASIKAKCTTETECRF